MTTPADLDPVWRPAPHEFADPSLPPAVRVYEVGPRDGLQAESNLVPTAVKAEFCRRLVSASFTTVFTPTKPTTNRRLFPAPSMGRNRSLLDAL